MIPKDFPWPAIRAALEKLGFEFLDGDDKLRSGSFAVVARARKRGLDPRIDGAIVAVRVNHDPIGFAVTDNELERLQKNRPLFEHPRVIPLHDLMRLRLDGDDRVWLVSWWQWAGQSLADRLKKCGGKGLPLEEALKYIQQAAEGMQYVAATHKYHGDIKPSNLLLDGTGNVRLGDVGLVKLLKESQPNSVNVHAPAYAAPEILRDREPTLQSDGYSLALTYVELRTGQLPAVLSDLSDLFPSEAAVVQKMLAADPAARPTPLEWAGELKSVVEAEQKQETGAAMPPATRSPVPHPDRKALEDRLVSLPKLEHSKLEQLMGRMGLMSADHPDAKTYRERCVLFVGWCEETARLAELQTEMEAIGIRP